MSTMLVLSIRFPGVMFGNIRVLGSFRLVDASGMALALPLRGGIVPMLVLRARIILANHMIFRSSSGWTLAQGS